MEYAEIGALTVAAYQADGLLGGGADPYERQLRDSQSRDRTAEVLVAVDADRVLGTLTWCPPGSPWRELATETDQGEFRMLAVAPTGRRRGVARALVIACLVRARREQMREMVISSLPEMTAAHALYRDLGFVRAPELDHEPAPSVGLWGFRLKLATTAELSDSAEPSYRALIRVSWAKPSQS